MSEVIPSLLHRHTSKYKEKICNFTGNSEHINKNMRDDMIFAYQLLHD